MADLLIRGMEMPQWCSACACNSIHYCQVLKRDVSDFLMTNRFPEDCPLVSLPEGHGRLGDLDALEDAFIRYYLSQERSNHLVFTPVEIKQHFADMIGDWPTIIEAEGGTDNG